MHGDTPPSDETILAIIGARIDPDDLIAQLRAEHDINNVIEALQRAIERGKITLDSDGMVVTAQVLAQAA